MAVFTDDLELIEYSIEETGTIEPNELFNFMESLEYDSEISLVLQIKDLIIEIEFSPQTEQESAMFGLSINQESINIPPSIKTLKSLGEFLFIYLNQNY